MSITMTKSSFSRSDGERSQVLATCDRAQFYVDRCTRCGALDFTVGSMSFGAGEPVVEDVTCNDCGTPLEVKRRTLP